MSKSPLALLKEKIRSICFESGVQLDQLFEEIDEKGNGIVFKPDFFGLLKKQKIVFDDEEQILLLKHFETANGSNRVSYPSFLRYIDMFSPEDYTDPELLLAILPQPYRRIVKVLEEDILDKVWSHINCNRLQASGSQQYNLLENKGQNCIHDPPSSIGPEFGCIKFVSSCKYSSFFAIINDENKIFVLNTEIENMIICEQHLFSKDYVIECCSQLSCGTMESTFLLTVCGFEKTNVESESPDEISRVVHVYCISLPLASINATTKIDVPNGDVVDLVQTSSDKQFLFLSLESGIGQLYLLPKEQIDDDDEQTDQVVLSGPSWTFNRDEAFLISKEVQVEFLVSPNAFVRGLFIYYKLSPKFYFFNVKVDLCEDKTVDVVDTASWTLPSSISCTCIDSTTKYIGIGLSSGGIIIWNTITELSEMILECHDSPVKYMAFYRNELLCTASVNHKIHFYDLKDRRSYKIIDGLGKTPLMTIESNGCIQQNFVCSQDIPLIVICLNSYLNLYNISTGEIVGSIQFSEVNLTTFCILAKDKLIAFTPVNREKLDVSTLPLAMCFKEYSIYELMLWYFPDFKDHFQNSQYECEMSIFARHFFSSLNKNEQNMAMEHSLSSDSVCLSQESEKKHEHKQKVVEVQPVQLAPPFGGREAIAERLIQQYKKLKPQRDRRIQKRFQEITKQLTSF